MSSLFEDLDDLMMPYRCVYNKAHTDKEWQEIYKWLDFTCGEFNWYIENFKFCFSKEEHLIMFTLRWQ